MSRNLETGTGTSLDAALPSWSWLGNGVHMVGEACSPMLTIQHVFNSLPSLRHNAGCWHAHLGSPNEHGSLNHSSTRMVLQLIVRMPAYLLTSVFSRFSDIAAEQPVADIGSSSHLPDYMAPSVSANSPLALTLPLHVHRV